VVPLEIVGFTGVTAMDCSVAAVTVRVVEPVTPLSVALISEVPVFTPVASPPGEVMVATEGVADSQFTVPVMLAVLLSL